MSRTCGTMLKISTMGVVRMGQLRKRPKEKEG